MEVENKAKASEYTEPPAGKKIIIIFWVKTKRMEVENKAKASKHAEPCTYREGNNLICLVKIKRMEVENKAKASKYSEPPAGKGIIWFVSRNKENGGREQGKGIQTRRTACREGNNLICLVKTKRMEVENKAKASKYEEPPTVMGIIWFV